jgi:hypothetical protein
MLSSSSSPSTPLSMKAAHSRRGDRPLTSAAATIAPAETPT